MSETRLKEACSHCKVGNVVSLGDTEDQTSPDVDAFRCWYCKKLTSLVTDETYLDMLPVDMEEWYIADGDPDLREVRSDDWVYRGLITDLRISSFQAADYAEPFENEEGEITWPTPITPGIKDRESYFKGWAAATRYWANRLRDDYLSNDAKERFSHLKEEWE